MRRFPHTERSVWCIKVLTYALLCLSLATVGCAVQAPAQFDLQTAMSGIVEIYKYYGTKPVGAGTGFIVIKDDRRCTLATAHHVAGNTPAEPLGYRFHGASEVERFSGNSYWDHRDLIFFEINPADCVKFNVHAFQLWPHGKDMLPGDEVMMLGHPSVYFGDNRGTPILRNGIVASTKFFTDIRSEPVLLLDFIAVGGFSGSPVIQKRSGQIIGILILNVGRFVKREPIEISGFAVAVPLTTNDLDLPFVPFKTR